MSQKKVDHYKAKKASREQEEKKERRMLALEKSVAVLILLLVVGWFGYSIYGKVQQRQDAKVTETVMDASAIDSYLSGLDSVE